MHLRYRFLALLLVLLLALAFTLALVTAASGGGPPRILFTDNLTAGGPSPDLTAMEQALLASLAAATTSVDLAIYDFNRPAIRDALLDAHGRGLAVRVVTDDDTYTDPDNQPYFAALETAGIPVIPDNRSSLMHNKFFIIDGQVVWTGSTNMTDNGFTFNHNNSLILTSTLLAEIYTLEFEEMFVAGHFGTAKSDNVTHTLTYNGMPLAVYFSPSDGAMSQVLTAVATADSSIHFAIFYFTDDGLRDALLARMQAGVAVHGVWDALAAGNPYSEDEVLCQAGADIKIEDFGGILHHKFMVIDADGSDPVVITGSMNWSHAGAQANDENTLLLYDEGVAQAYLAAFTALYTAVADDRRCGPPPPADALTFLPLVIRPRPAQR